MAGFGGGSAWSKTRELAGGFASLNDRSVRRLTPAEITQLSHEIERYQRELRGSALPGEEQTAVQNRNRALQRLNTAIVVLRACRSRR